MSFGQKINAAVRLLEAEKKLPPGLRAAPCCRSPKKSDISSIGTPPVGLSFWLHRSRRPRNFELQGATALARYARAREALGPTLVLLRSQYVEAAPLPCREYVDKA